ncbi:PREDICTED: targeting protein for Xklp2 homolog [Polistes canadensis]|uniref:targeting protein for Xklp2 homolog n=1 Tax=Polistes canadensis TaxID=91411 RepID=UPI000718C741|nr:PREDICTED: targeting protein for Xklp2 homolog [Polistes canadensis]
MDNYCSPQYVDFTSNLEEPSDDYFNKDHGIEKSKESIEIPKVEVILCDEKECLSEEIVEETKESMITEKITDEIAEEIVEEIVKETTEVITKETKESMQSECTPNVNTKLETELDIIKNTPIKVICSSSSSTQGSSKCKLVKKVTYNDVMQEAREALQNFVITPSSVFKKPMSIKSQDNNQVNCPSNKQTEKLSDEKIKILSSSERGIYMTPQKNLPNIDISPINLFMLDEHDQKLDSNNSPKLLNIDTPCEKNQSKLSMESNNSKKQSRRLSFQCRRQSLKIRRNSNKYISLAAAVLTFQNKTPERFHTRSIKERKESKLDVSKENQLKLKSGKHVFSGNSFQIPVNKNITSKESKIITPKSSSANKVSQDKNALSTVANYKSRRSSVITSIKTASKDKNTPSMVGDAKSRRSCIVTSTKKASNDKNTLSTIGDTKSRRSCIVTSTEKASNNKNTPSTVGDAKSRRSCIVTSTKKVSNDKNTPSTVGDAKSRRSCLTVSTKKVSQNKNVSTFVNSSSSELVIKKEKILFFDIPIDSKPRKITRPIPFSFESRDKLKEQFKLKQSQLDKGDNKTIENHQNKKDTSKTKLYLPACSSTSKKITNVNVHEKKLLKLDENSTKQEDRQSDIDASMTSEINLDQKGNIRPKIMKIGMNSYERGKQRQEFDEKIKQKLAMQEKQREQEKAEQLAKEKLQVAMLRKQTKVKAKPMPVYKPLCRIKSTKPLTEPHSPAWAHKNKKETS